MSVRACLTQRREFRTRPKLELLETRTVPTILVTEHVDIGIAFEDNAWDLHIHDETNGVEYEPGAALLYAGSNTMTTQPAHGYRFIGAAPGSPIWVLPQVNDPNVLFVGFGAEEIQAGTFTSYFEADQRIQSEGEWIRLELIDVRGPDGGKFTVWQTNSFGNPTVWMATHTARPPDAFFLQPGDHAHINVAFTKTGVYEVDFRASAFRGPGMTKQVVSDVVTYHFGVEDCGSFCPPLPLSDTKTLVTADAEESDTADGISYTGPIPDFGNSTSSGADSSTEHRTRTSAASTTYRVLLDNIVAQESSIFETLEIAL